jgi:serine protease Do
VLVWRDGKEVNVDVTIGILDEVKMASGSPVDAKKQIETSGKKLGALGLTLGEATPPIRERFKLDAAARGVVVTEVADDGVAFEKGVRPGDLIVEVSQQEVTTPKQVIDKVDAARKNGEKRILLLIEGQSGLRFLALSIDKN